MSQTERESQEGEVKAAKASYKGELQMFSLETWAIVLSCVSRICSLGFCGPSPPGKGYVC